MVLTPVAFDIETTGFDVTDEVTVAGFALPLGCRVFTRPSDAGETDADVVETAVRDETGERVNVSVHESEAALLEAVGAFVADRVANDDVLLVAYNGERWGGGFDFPFLRTRLAVTGVAWPFGDVPYADLLPVVQRQFNTTRDGDDRDGLVAAYGVLVDDGVTAVDPFEDSAAAVTAFNDGETVKLVTHNVADVLRTRALAQLAEQYCSKSDFNVKSLTPTRTNE